jgi:hypothetical protein
VNFLNTRPGVSLLSRIKNPIFSLLRKSGSYHFPFRKNPQEIFPAHIARPSGSITGGSTTDV